MYRNLLGLATIATVGIGTAAPAASIYRADLQTLNNSGVQGSVTVTIDGDSLTYQTAILGLEADQPHVAHFHGLFSNLTDGDVVDSTSPTLANDTDGDGFVELLEALPNYGPILVSLTEDDGTPFTTADGVLTRQGTFDLEDSSIFADGYDRDDLLPLDLREFVIHGLTVPAGIGAGTDGEVNGDGGYLAVLPVAAGEFTLIASDGNGGPQAVPTPTAAMAGLGLLALAANRRRRAEATANA